MSDRGCDCGEQFDDLDLSDVEWPRFEAMHRGTFGHDARVLNQQVHGLGDALLAWFGGARDSFLRRARRDEV